MAKLALTEAKKLTKDYYNVFKGVYNDFKLISMTEYKFELEPLECEAFLESVDAGLIDCYILLEDNIPTGFLAYTTAISDALELNIVHCMGEDNLNEKRKILISKFLEENEDLIKNMVVTYPMMGSQNDFVPYLTHLGFKLVNIAVVRFNFANEGSVNILNNIYDKVQISGYELRPWSDSYLDAAATLINEAFKDTADALFDPRFKTKEGSLDVLQKIVSGFYGEFLPDAMRLAFCNDEMCGICLVNVTTGTIGNIPLFGLAKPHRGKGLSKYLLSNVVKNIYDGVQEGKYNLTEINASVETDNAPAVKMYRHIGFKEDYSYPQSYLPVKGDSPD